MPFQLYCASLSLLTTKQTCRAAMLTALTLEDCTAGAQILHSCSNISQHHASKYSEFIKLSLLCQPSLSPMVHLHACTAAMLASLTAAKSLAGAQTFHSSSRGYQKHACQASAFVNPCMLCLAQLELTTAKQTCEAAMPAWATAEQGMNGHGTFHTIFLSSRQHACQVSASVKLPQLC